jgi:hypothetical protein
MGVDSLSSGSSNCTHNLSGEPSRPTKNSEVEMSGAESVLAFALLLAGSCVVVCFIDFIARGDRNE